MRDRYRPNEVPTGTEVSKNGLNEAWIKELVQTTSPSAQVWQATKRATGLTLEGVPMECSFVVEVGSTDIRAAEGIPAPLNPASLLEAVFYGMSKPQTGEP